MPRGASVVRYQGKRGAVWRIKYRDAAGKQVQETLGPEPPWTERKAQRELGQRLAAVDEGFRKPNADDIRRVRRALRPRVPPWPEPQADDDRELPLHARPPPLAVLRRPHPRRDRGASRAHRRATSPSKAEAGLSPKTIQNHLLLLNVMLRRAVVWRLIRTNPVSSVDRPRLAQPEMSVLTEVEIARLTAAYDQLAAEASDAERPWWQLAKAIVLTALGTAMRRGELVGLRWRAVNLLEAKIEVRETYVRGRFTTPKSKASLRVIELGPRTLAVIEEQWRGAAYRADDDLVFCHPTKGTPLETSSLAKRYLKPALARAGIEKPFRPFHDLRHTSLTHAAAAGNPQIYVQARAGHSQGAITERYMHAAQILFPGAAAKSEERMFGAPGPADIDADDQSAQEADD